MSSWGGEDCYRGISSVGVRWVGRRKEESVWARCWRKERGSGGGGRREVVEARALVAVDEGLGRGGGGLQWSWKRTFGRMRMRAMRWRSETVAGASERVVEEVMTGGN